MVSIPPKDDSSDLPARASNRRAAGAPSSAISTAAHAAGGGRRALSRRLSPRRHRGRTLVLVGLGVLLAVSALPTTLVLSLHDPGRSLLERGPLGMHADAAGSPTFTAASLVKGTLVADTPGSFWSVDAQTSCATCLSSSPSVTGFLASTPFTWVRYGQSIDSCNISAGRLYSASGSVSSGCGFDVASLKTWCASTTPRCHAIIALPGENNNSGEDAAIARWIVQTVGFQPAYWSIGNEPTGWTHYGIPWTSWRSTDHSAASPLAYAFDVKSAIAAVSGVDPGARFIGIEAACSCNTAWFQDVARVDGAVIAAIAFHNYPSSGTTRETLSQFYAPLASSHNVTSSVATVRSAIRGSCASCATMPLFVNEYNAGPGWAPSNFGGTYANAVFLAASVVQALLGNVTQLTIFNLQSRSSGNYGFSLMDSKGTVGPAGTLFSGLLRHLATGVAYSERISPGAANAWVVLTGNASTESLLVVNANPARGLSLTLPSGLLPGLFATVYRWGPAMSTPTSSGGLAPLTWSIPAQGILLIDEPLGKVGVMTPVTPPPATAAGTGTFPTPTPWWSEISRPPVFAGGAAGVAIGAVWALARRARSA